DLSGNNISHLPDFVFSRYHYLEELNLGQNGIEFLTSETFNGLSRLKELILQDNNLTSVPVEALRPLVSLETLRLDGNMIADIPPALAELNHVTKLCLGSNYLTRVPTEALSVMFNLEALDLSGNDIVEVKNYSFVNSSQLEAFEGLHNLKILELNNNYLKTIPSALTKLTSLERLTVAYNNIRYIDDDVFRYSQNLEVVEMKKNPIQDIGHYAFSNMTKLKKLIISEVKELDQFLDLNGTVSLEILRIDRARISQIPNNLCQALPKLKSLDLKSNLLNQIPNLKSCHGLRLLDLVHNEIENIHENAFLPLKQLEDLNLGNNRFSTLPSTGLINLRHLKTFNNKFLKEFPPSTSFPKIQSLALSYAYHCCEFLTLSHPDASHQSMDVNEVIIWPPKDKLPDLSLWNANNTDIWPGFENLTANFGEFADDIWGNFGPDYTYPSNLPQLVEEYFEDYKSQHINEPTARQGIQCIPKPGPFMPCEDLFDWWTLRCGVWIVFLLAMLGNGTVVFVLVFSRSKLDVPRFLVCNLALADFFMGIYLGFLAVVDASTLGEFKMFAIKWQSSAACQVAGFLGVLSSELSVLTLAVITLERNYAITHAMHLNKRLSLRHASYIMGCGWTYAIAISALPLFGISDYRKFAICLPFETEDSDWSLAYVVFLMSFNGLAFLILMGCYLKMYCAIRGSQAWNSNDSRIAKRMALLVFTDFICWAPIAFFSLTAAFGLQLISLEEAKVFTVFILPLNSCANPFLYAILTKQFKKDCVLICKAIEESRVTRGIGHCRHSSNFSNRQTPGNTNSVERNSSNNGQVCNCHLKTKPGVVSGEKSKRKSWSFSTVRYFLCDAGEPEQDSTNDYAYALAEIQRKQHNPHKRHSSVSSENFSSSRSDSWKQQHLRRDLAHGPAARLLDKRRRNSWSINRKPSQESNLSNSRNDSSATTASTSTWRVSRSSVSSDGSAPKSRDKPCGAHPERESTLQNSRYGSVRDKQPAVQSPKRSVRPKLQRQVAIDDHWPNRSMSIESQKSFDQMSSESAEKYYNNKLSDIVLEVNPSCKDDHPQIIGVESSYKPLMRHGLSVCGFVPRKLSTISSRSCSVNIDPAGNSPSTEDLGTDAHGPSGCAARAKQTRSLSLLLLPKESQLIPKRFASDDTLQTPPDKRQQKSEFSFDDNDDNDDDDDDDDDVFDDRLLNEGDERNGLLQTSANSSDKVTLCNPKEKQVFIQERTK
uniref:G-protein coupled receptors family 1 profile domain-containing protein n=1 Tax=Strigamia maritima TaxID=126957 RepID=T1IXW6_STRMM